MAGTGPAAVGRAGALRTRPWPAAPPRLARQVCEFSVVDFTASQLDCHPVFTVAVL